MPLSYLKILVSLSEILTGHFPWEIKLSVVVSIFSLAWGSSRAFFIERTKDEADPDPAFFMVALRVLPYMLVISVDSMLMWVLMGGILGETLKI